MRASAQAFAPVKKFVCGQAAVTRVATRMRRLLPLLALLPVLSTLLSCHKNTAAATPTVTVVVAPATASLNLGMSTTFGAAVAGGALNTVTWSVNGVSGGNSTFGTIQVDGTVQSTLSPTGNTITLTTYTAPAVMPSNSQVTISATSADDTTVITNATLTVLPNAVVTVTPKTPPPYAAGAQVAFTATVTPAPSPDVIWEVNGLPGGFQTVGIISNAGVYTAPPSPPPGGIVTITAVSVADTTQSGSTTAAVTFGNASMQGPYSFTLRGTNASGTFVRAGSFVADGQGHIASGMEDVTGSSGAPTHITFVGSDTVGADGRGTLQFNDGLLPSQFHIVMPSYTQAQIISYDAAGTASGLANLQSTAAFKPSSLLGTYLFDFAGLDSAGKQISDVGEFVANGQGGISSGVEDVNDNGALSAQVPFAGTYTVNGNGRGTAQFVTGTATFNFSVYVDNSGEIKFVSLDPSPAAAVAGEVTQQAPGAVFTQNSLNGNYSFLIAGSSSTGNIATAGMFSTAGNGLLTNGVLDENNAGVVAANQAFTGTSTVSATGRGTATLNALNRTYQLVFYLDGQGGAVFQEADLGATSDGLLVQQQIAPTLAGSYALSLTGMTGATTQQFAGQLSVNSSGSVTSGMLDFSSYPSGVLVQNETLSGTLTASPGTRGTLSLNPSTDVRNFVVYIAGASRIFVLEIDAGVISDGSLFKQF